MAEAATSKRLMAALRAGNLDPVRIENLCEKGTPDVNCSLGWIEVKHLRSWPRLGSPLKISHFSQEQRVWLLRRWRSGGACWLFLQVDREYLLFTGIVASQQIGQAGEEDLRRLALGVWTGGLDDKELVGCLRTSLLSMSQT